LFEDYVANDELIAKKSLQESLEKIKKDSVFDELIFYPEYHRQLEGKVYTNSLLDRLAAAATLDRFSTLMSESFLAAIQNIVPGGVLLQLPFYDSVICPIFPFRTAENFAVGYGFSYEDFLLMMDQGKVLPVLAYDPEDYINCSYLLPMLSERRPPIFDIRFEAYSLALLCKSIKRGVDISSALQNPNLPPTDVRELRSRFSREFLSLSAEEMLQRSNRPCMSARGHSVEVLTTYGRADLVPKALELPNDLSSMLDADRLTLKRSLEVFTCVMTSYLSLDGIISVTDLIPGSESGRIEIFPLDVAKALVTQLPLFDFSKKLNCQEVLTMSHETARARRALFELESAVRNCDTSKVEGGAKALPALVREANEIAESMIKRRKKIERYVMLAFGAFGGIISYLGGLPPLPSALGGFMGGIVSSVPLSDPIADCLVKLGVPSHVVAVYNLKQALSTTSVKC
jgi:hypothetical protein